MRQYVKGRARISAHTACQGQRLNQRPYREVRVGDLSIAQATELSISDALAHFKKLTFGPAI